MPENAGSFVEKAALRLIARAEQCSCGLSRKLEKRGFDAASISEVISKLTEMNLLDDGRFARMHLRSRLRLTRSPRRLSSSLRARGIGRDEAQAALKEVLDQDAELALLARFVKKYPEKAAGRSRNYGADAARSMKYFLKSEGFSPAAIEQFLETQTNN